MHSWATLVFHNQWTTYSLPITVYMKVHKLLYYIVYFYDKWKSTVVIKLEDVLFPVVTRSGNGCWYLFGSEVFFSSPPPCCIPVLLYCRCQTS